jgi:hypothetical protein
LQSRRAGCDGAEETPKEAIEDTVEVATDRQRNEHDGERNRNLHGVVEHGLAHDSSPFTGDISKLAPTSLDLGHVSRAPRTLQFTGDGGDCFDLLRRASFISRCCFIEARVFLW